MTEVEPTFQDKGPCPSFPDPDRALRQPPLPPEKGFSRVTLGPDLKPPAPSSLPLLLIHRLPVVPYMERSRGTKPLPSTSFLVVTMKILMESF